MLRWRTALPLTCSHRLQVSLESAQLVLTHLRCRHERSEELEGSAACVCIQDRALRLYDLHSLRLYELDTYTNVSHIESSVGKRNSLFYCIVVGSHTQRRFELHRLINK
jgi:hypothetical protein